MLTSNNFKIKKQDTKHNDEQDDILRRGNPRTQGAIYSRE